MIQNDCMKIYAVITFFLLSTLSLAQSDKPLKLSVGYYSQLGYQPGVSSSLSIPIKQWEKERKKSIRSTLTYEPSVSFFTRVGYNMNFLAGNDIVLRVRKGEKKTYSGFLFGINYLGESEVLSVSVNLAGKITGREREFRHYMLTTIGYEFGGKLGDSWEWYGRFAPGYRISIDKPNAFTVMIGAGVRIPIGNNE